MIDAGVLGATHGVDLLYIFDKDVPTAETTSRIVQSYYLSVSGDQHDLSIFSLSVSSITRQFIVYAMSMF